MDELPYGVDTIVLRMTRERMPPDGSPVSVNECGMLTLNFTLGSASVVAFRRREMIVYRVGGDPDYMSVAFRSADEARPLDDVDFDSARLDPTHVVKVRSRLRNHLRKVS